MKTELAAILMTLQVVLFCQNSHSQNIAVTNDNSYNPHPSAMLDVKATDKGLLIPRLTTVQRMAISNPANGLLVFDSDLMNFYFFDGSLWTLITSGLTGDYNELTNKPDFTGWDTNAADDFNGQYGNLTGTPILAPVATSGNYNDLTNKPVIPAPADGSETKVSAGANIVVSGTGTAANPYLVGVTPGTSPGQTQYWNGTQWITNNSNIYNNGANVGIGTTAPASKLSAGTNSTFQVSNTGNMVKLNNVTTSFPSAQGDANSLLSNDGSGNLSWSYSPVFENITVDGNSLFEVKWAQKADIPSPGRSEAVGFSIGSKGYICTGKNTSGKDLWEYDPNSNTWTQKADFGGEARYGATAFSIGSKGYVGAGAGSGSTLYKDFWEYNPTSNTWTQKADFGGSARCYATGFSIGSKGYIGIGGTVSSTYYSDFWEYNPSTNAWTQKVNFGGSARGYAAGFSIGTKGYVCAGLDGAVKNDLWEYDPVSNTWNQKANLGGAARFGAFGFAIGSKGYICAGLSTVFLSDCWEYDPALNAWSQKADYGGGPRGTMAGFVIGQNAYAGTGINNIYWNDFWVYGVSLSESISVNANDVPGLALPAGVIQPYLGSTPPDGYLFCNGSAVSRGYFSQLFAAIGTNYGEGNGTTTFNLPNLQGRVPVGYSQSAAFNAMGKTGGEKYVTINESQMPSHNHNVSISGGAHDHNWNGYYTVGSGSKQARSREQITADPTDVCTNNDGSHTHTYTESSKGGNNPHNNVQPYFVVNYIIKY